ncbi:MAG TPA: aminomethyltransferase family protein [Solirubrobacteraceae bacterium]|nr:aminomethyltransferase family protein [Solirubrobacteraceae bacterium]
MAEADQQNLIRSPLADRYLRDDHVLFDAYGMALPLVFEDTDAEYRAIREAVALMDWTPLAKVDVEGPDAKAKLNELVTRDLSRVPTGRVAYTAIVGDDGLMRDDSTVMIRGEDRLRVVGSPTMPPEVIPFAEERGLRAVERRDELVHLPIQGPRSREVLAALTSIDVSNGAFPYYTFREEVTVGGVSDVFVTRMGYTAELGYELFAPVQGALQLYDSIMEAGAPAGIRFVGIEAILIARTESGMVLGDVEYDSTISPWECGLGWTVDMEKAHFRGRDALRELREQRTLRLASVVLDHGDDAATGAPLSVDGNEAGRITLAVRSPHLGGKTLGLAHVHEGWATPGTRVLATVSNEQIEGEIVRTPVYDPDRVRVRS